MISALRRKLKSRTHGGGEAPMDRGKSLYRKACRAYRPRWPRLAV